MQCFGSVNPTAQDRDMNDTNVCSSSKATKGGMCANPFGGESRTDRLGDDHFFSTRPGDGLGALSRSTICDAVNCFLWFGLGRNGFLADEFLSAYSYFFEITEDPNTWPEESRKIEGVHESLTEARREYKVFDLTDDEVVAMTFPTHYEVAGFHRSMTISRFRRMLIQKRKRIVEANIDQIKDYLRELRQAAAKRGQYLRAGAKATQTLLEALVEPEAESMAGFIYSQRPVAQTVHRTPFILPRRRRGRRLEPMEWQQVAKRRSA